MSIELKIKPEEITGNRLFNIYKLFCEAYDENVSENDKGFFKGYRRHGEFIKGLALFRMVTNEGIYYKPYEKQARFHSKKTPRSTIQFWGELIPENKKKQKKFEELVEENFQRYVIKT